MHKPRYKQRVSQMYSRLKMFRLTRTSTYILIALLAGGITVWLVKTHAGKVSNSTQTTYTSIPATTQNTTKTTNNSATNQKIDSIKVTKAYTNTTTTAKSGGEMLIKASSSNPNAQLYAYRPDGTLIGEVQNGGGSQYGGTVMPFQKYYSATVTITSTSGGSITVPTTAFQ